MLATKTLEIPMAWRRGPKARALERERERERERLPQGARPKAALVRAGQLGFFSRRSQFRTFEKSFFVRWIFAQILKNHSEQKFKTISKCYNFSMFHSPAIRLPAPSLYKIATLSLYRPPTENQTSRESLALPYCKCYRNQRKSQRFSRRPKSASLVKSPPK